MNSYKCSDGSRIDQSKIDRKIRNAKSELLTRQLEEYGYHFCDDCGANEHSGPLDCSHNISVGDAKKMGRTELAWTISNLRVRCRKCHTKLDKLDLKYARHDNAT